ncbi:hypothetical protein B6U91_01465 [Candidatus Pacearchaeota archaeon ex4484_71]|nr:MAG: hypothetical protein B6U91_01465 [Candidatus Pacearchaeota archaeon ex4484_71]
MKNLIEKFEHFSGVDFGSFFGVLIIILSILLFSGLKARGQATMQVYTRVTSSTLEPDVNIWFQKALTQNKKVGVWGFLLVEENWAEAYGGILYSPIKCLELTFGAGIEQSSENWRLSANMFFTKKNIHFLLATEKGAGEDNWWYKSFLTYSLKNFDVGVMSWRFHGTGPYVCFNSNTGLSFWVNPGRDLELGVNRVMVGIDFHID